MMPERPQMVCLRADQHDPYVPSIQVECALCGADLWRSLGSMDLDAETVCIRCVPADERPDLKIRPAEYMAAYLMLNERERADLDRTMDAFGIQFAVEEGDDDKG